ncbi:NAD(P)-binding domain-containing protein [Microbacterium sp. bgisy189]|uniref:NAD(P)-binding domain-containing protein n=1 Tax=Microbacterium sp. bgisy189 TaxID=3413798 RepID=UPI003EB9FCC7
MTLLDLTPTRPHVATISHPVVIIGAGPVGLAAAAHLATREIPFELFEAGDIADAVDRWGHTRLFSPWRYLVDPVAVELLETTSWAMPPADIAPIGTELREAYLRPLAELPQLATHLHTGARVTGVSRQGMDRTRTRGRAAAPFVLRVQRGDREETVLASAVIDASGTFDQPSPLASDGLPLRGADDIGDALVGPLPDVLGSDRHRFEGRRVSVVGAGHSAANTLLALVALADEAPATRIAWVIRTADAVRVSSSSDDELPDRAALGRRLDAHIAAGRIDVVDRFETDAVRRVDGGIELIGRSGPVSSVHATDVVVASTGFRPDLGMLRELRLDFDEIVEAPRRLAPLIDPNVHSCGTVEPHGFRELAHPEEHFFVVGMKSYGRAPTFLLATGYEQVRSVVAAIAGDLEAASHVQLELPATGVCSTGGVGEGCCG